MRIGLLYENREQLLAAPGAQEHTHYHWREPEEVAAVAAALRCQGHQVQELVGVEALLQHCVAAGGERPDLVINLSVRTRSRSRTAIAPALLEELAIPYTGADAAAKALALNKDWLKPLLGWAGIATPPWRRYADAAAVEALPPWPVSVLKPSSEGYSLGLERFENDWGLGALRQRVEQLGQAFGGAVLCEQLVAGREITVGLAGPGGPAAWTLLGAVETVDGQGAGLGQRLLDLAAKRQGGYRKLAADLSEPALQPLRSAALGLAELLGPVDYATLDFRIDAEGRPQLIDLNLDATLHPQRSLAMVAAHSGLAYDGLITTIVEACRRRHGLG